MHFLLSWSPSVNNDQTPSFQSTVQGGIRRVSAGILVADKENLTTIMGIEKRTQHLDHGHRVNLSLWIMQTRY